MLQNVMKVIIILGITLLLNKFSLHFVEAGSFMDESNGQRQTVGPNGFNIGQLKKGDIILGHNPGGLYGKYTHAMLAYNNAQSVGYGGEYYATIIESTTVQPSIRLWNAEKIREFYDHAVQLQIQNITSNERNSIIEQANWFRLYSNGDYAWTSQMSENTRWYCSKFVWRSIYDATGNTIGGGMNRYLYVPDELYQNYKTIVIQDTQVSGTSSISLDITNYEDLIRSNEVEILKIHQLDMIKENSNLHKKWLKDGLITKEEFKSLKEDTKENLYYLRVQIKKVEQDPISKIVNMEIIGEEKFYEFVKSVKLMSVEKLYE